MIPYHEPGEWINSLSGISKTDFKIVDKALYSRFIDIVSLNTCCEVFKEFKEKIVKINKDFYNSILNTSIGEKYGSDLDKIISDFDGNYCLRYDSYATDFDNIVKSIANDISQFEKSAIETMSIKRGYDELV